MLRIWLERFPVRLNPGTIFLALFLVHGADQAQWLFQP